MTCPECLKGMDHTEGEEWLCHRCAVFWRRARLDIFDGAVMASGKPADCKSDAKAEGVRFTPAPPQDAPQMSSGDQPPPMPYGGASDPPVGPRAGEESGQPSQPSQDPTVIEAQGAAICELTAENARLADMAEVRLKDAQLVRRWNHQLREALEKMCDLAAMMASRFKKQENRIDAAVQVHAARSLLSSQVSTHRPEVPRGPEAEQSPTSESRALRDEGRETGASVQSTEPACTCGSGTDGACFCRSRASTKPACNVVGCEITREHNHMFDGPAKSTSQERNDG